MENLALTESTYYILLSLYRPQHGYGIMQQTEQLSGGRVRLAAGTLYGALNSLCEKGWIRQLPIEHGSRKRVSTDRRGSADFEARTGSFAAAGCKRREHLTGEIVMSERKTIHRVFWEWDFEKEERWLNEMAMNGWALEKAYFATYIFAPCEPGEYIFRMEMNSNKDYRSFVEGLGAEYVGSCVTWMYFRRKAELGAFDLFSDIDSRIAHLDRIGKTTWLLCLANLLIGVANLLGGRTISIINLLCAALLSYGLGRIHGKKESLESERLLHE